MAYRAILQKRMQEMYRWPAGWDTREKVAVQLGCSPDRVREVLAPCIKAGEVEVKQIKVFRDGKFSMQTGYRVVPKGKSKK